MAIDDDPLVVASRQLADHTESDAETIRGVVLNKLMESVPIIGDVIVGSIAEVAQKRWKERVSELLQMFAERLAEVRTAIPDPNYFGSEEFQALIIEAIEQQRTNRFTEKRRMLACGLAQSGTQDFVSEPEKEVFFRLLRDLSMQDLAALKKLRPNKEVARFNGPSKITVRQTQDNTALNRLQGFGLVSSTLQLEPKNVADLMSIRTQNDVNRAIGSVLSGAPTSVFFASRFGLRFLAFLTGSEEEDQHA